MRGYFSFFLTLLLLQAIQLNAQSRVMHLRHITSENGLSDNEVTSVIQDRQGYVWIGTRSGLNRYDSRDFYHFRHIENDTNSICGDHITCLETDNDSLLWIGTATSGISCYNFHTGKFRNYTTSNSQIPSNNIISIAFDSLKNRLYIGTNIATTSWLDKATNKIHLFPAAQGWNNRTCWSIEIKNGKTYFALQSLQLGILDHTSLRLPKTPPHHKTVNCIYATETGPVFAGMWNNALYEYDADANFLNSYIFDQSDSINSASDEIISLSADHENQLWCGTKYSGLLLFNLGSKTFARDIQMEPAVPSRINQLYFDKNHRMWIASNSGLFIYDPLFNQFQKTTLPVPEGEFAGKVIDRIFTPGGKEFIIAEGAIFYRMHADAPYVYKSIRSMGDLQKLFSVLQTKANKIFIGSNKSVHELDTNTVSLKRLDVLRKNPDDFFFNMNSSRITSLAEWVVGKDTLLAAAAYGYFIYLINFKTRNVHALNPIRKNGTGTSEHLVKKIFVSKKNELWKCGLTKGIEKITHTYLEQNTKPLPFDTITIDSFNVAAWFYNDPTPGITDVYDLLEKQDGTFLFTTQGAGVIDFNPDQQPIQYKRKAMGNAYWGGYLSDQNNLWLSSSKGLYHYQLDKDYLQLYDPSYGVPGELSTYFFSDLSSTAGIGCTNGFITFRPGKIMVNTEKPQVHISRMWIMDQPSDSLLFQTIRLDHRQNFIKFNVATNSFSDNEQTKIFYRLLGLDDTWYANGTNTLIVYTNLKHGSYTLQVKAVNINGKESDVHTLHFSIIPPFYQTIWFQLLAITGLCTLIYLTYRYRIRQVMKLQEVRNKIARDLHDDIGSTLGSIHLYSQIAHKKLDKANGESIVEILEKIENSSEEIIEKTADAVWVAKASNDTISSLVLRMESYAASLLGAADIHFQFVHQQKINDQKLSMSQRKNVFLIYKEAIHNIIKHAGCSEVIITVDRISGRLTITIQDNGKGLGPSSDRFHQGNGLKNMHTRAAEMNGTFRIEDVKEGGTRIVITL